MEREVFLVITYVLCYLIAYALYVQRLEERRSVENRPSQVITGTGAPGRDATTVIPGPSGRDGVLIQTDPATRESLKTMLVNHWSTQRQFQKHLLLLSVFTGCLIAGNSGVLWYTQHLSFVAVGIVSLGAILWGAFTWFYIRQSDEAFYIPPSVETDTMEQKKYYTDLLNGRDYYQVLEVPLTASSKDIKGAYRKQSLKYHPDKTKDPCTAVNAAQIQRIRRDDDGYCFITLTQPVSDIFRNGDLVSVDGILGGITITTVDTNADMTTVEYVDDEPNTFRYLPKMKKESQPFNVEAEGGARRIFRGECIKRTNDFFVLIATAYNVLIDEAKRDQYDAVRRRFKRIPPVQPPATTG
jgi:hypothetical protein